MRRCLNWDLGDDNLCIDLDLDSHTARECTMCSLMSQFIPVCLDFWGSNAVRPVNFEQQPLSS